MTAAQGAPRAARDSLPVQGAWVALVALVLGLFVGSIPANWAFLHQLTSAVDLHPAQLTPEGLRLLQQAGLSMDFYATYQIAVQFIFLLMFTAIGGLLLARRPNDRMAAFTGFTLPLFAAGFVLPYNSLGPAPVALLAQTLGLAGSLCLDVFLYVFPDGQFVPGWTRWLMAGWVINEVNNTFAPPLLGQEPFATLAAVLFPILLFSSLGAQVYRYRRVSSPVEQHQTKWVVFGLTAAIAGFVAVVVGVQLLPSTLVEPGSLGFFVGWTGTFVFLLAIPVSIAIAILRSHLYDIDVIIRRTLIYAALTASLLGVYFGGVLLLEALLQPLTGSGNDLAIVATTLLIAALFNPLRRRIQAFIDQRFYRRKYDAAKIVTAFGAHLREEVDLPALTGKLVTVVDETMQPASVALWLRVPEPRRLPTAGRETHS